MYRSIYDQGVEPKTFINDFLELLYYFKNINSLEVTGNNFSLNDEEFNLIKKISDKIDQNTLILFWQFTIKTLSEIDVVSNPNLSIEMFFIRLIHLKDINNFSGIKKSDYDLPNIDNNISVKNSLSENKDLFDLKNKTVGQIKNITQENQPDIDLKENKKSQNLLINSFNELLKICILKKEMKLKYELEKNVNLVSFDKQRIEISFNEDLDKEFIKILSSKLYDWTGKRWIITLSREKGDLSIKEKESNNKNEIISKMKETISYKKMLENFPDAEIIDVDIKKNNND